MAASLRLWCVGLAWLGLCLAKNCPASHNEAISACVLPVAQYADALSVGSKEPSSNGVQLVTGMGADDFNELCFLIKRFDECVKTSRRECPRHITLSLIDASYGYLCNDGYDIFMANANCLMKLDQEEKVRQCHNSTLTVIRASSEESTLSLTAKKNRMCSLLNFFAKCVKDPVQLTCGGQAWGVIVRVLMDTTKTLMPSCVFETQLLDPSDPDYTTAHTALPRPQTALSNSSRASQAPLADLITASPVGSERRGPVSLSPVLLPKLVLLSAAILLSLGAYFLDYIN